MPRAADRYFDALSESGHVLVDSMKATTERNMRVARTLLSEFERNQEDAIELGRRFASQPTDIRGFMSAWTDTTNRQRARGVELARELLEEITDAMSDTRSTVTKIFNATRTANEAAVDGARSVARDTADSVREGVTRATRRAADVAEEAADRAEQATDETAQRVRETASRARSNASE